MSPNRCAPRSRCARARNATTPCSNGMTEGFALHEIICDENGEPCDYRFLEINPSFERLTGP